jgi:uncharacterized protein YPO0396
MSGAGFKLERFEVYNWGTFNEKVWTIEPKGFSTLLTGENGSGKSTLVDALLTLLVPNVKRNYNLASGNEKKERTELTYVRGAYAREQNELGGGQTKFLRKEENYSVLLAKFNNELTRELITLGQFFWFEQTTLHKLFFISHSDISIHEHFSRIKNSKEVRSRLKAIPQTTLFTTFSEYQAYFIRYVGFRSEKGLDLFNQITAIKEINRLNEFVRKHMLNANESQELLNALYTNYQNLELAYQAILLSKNQLDELNPLVEENKKFASIQIKLGQLQQERQALPYCFARHKNEVLARQQSDCSRKLIEGEAQLKTVEFKLKSMHEQKLELLRLISQDEAGQELERLKLILGQYEEKRKFAQKHADDYAKLAKTLGLSVRPNLKEFAQNLEHCHTRRSSTETQLTELRNQHYLHKKEQDRILQEIETLLSEVKSLKNRKNRLPMNMIQVRDEIVQALSIPSNAAPFVAELMKVHDPEWEGAIEKLLHSFALRMLVPQDKYADVCKLLNRKNIGIRLVFQKVDEQFNVKLPALNQIESNKLFHKLEFRNNSPYIQWLKEQIIKQYDYSCVEELSVFQKQFKAITSQGLIKHGLHLNEKDDRFSIQDKNRFILGWNNQEKLDWLLKEIQTRQKSHDRAVDALQSTERLISRAESALIAMQALGQIDDFSTIDEQSITSEMDKLKKRQAMLMDKNHKSGRIQKDLQSLENDLQANQDLRDQSLKEMAILHNTRQELAREIDYCEKTLSGFEKMVEESEWVKAFMKKRKLNFAHLSLRDYGLWEKTALDELNAQVDKSEAERQHLQVVLVRKMTQFKTRFSEYVVDLDTTMESLNGYVELQKKLQAESLPEHERRFRKLLNKSVINDMAAFKSTLDLAYEEIEGTIQELNRVLMSMDYSPNSYVQLQLTRNKDVEVREFHHLLKYALLDSQIENNQEADSEVCFERIKTLLDRLKHEERWCKKVTDVRNWADFSVLEKVRGTDEQKNYYSDSAGLSGGQKVKLAFTILGSAIAYQYGLDLEEAHAHVTKGRKSSGNSFRFIVIDEAFSKSDEKNSRYAMALFQNLGLQVMVVTPKDKIHVVEPYIQSIFLTYMNEGEDRSQLINLSFERSGENIKAQQDTSQYTEPLVSVHS